MTPHLQILVHPETWLLCPVQFHPSPWQWLVLLCLCQSTMIQASQNYKNYMFICNSNRHFKIQSFNEAIPKYTQADPRRLSDVPKGMEVAKQKVLKEFMFQ